MAEYAMLLGADVRSAFTSLFRGDFMDQGALVVAGAVIACVGLYLFLTRK